MKNIALVKRSTGSWYKIMDVDTHQNYEARARGKLKLNDAKLTNPIAVGDLVEYEVQEGEENMANITHILPRKNYLMRKSVNLSKQHHIIASNLDFLVFIFTLKDPETSLGFLDRALVAAEAFSISVLLVFNKIDLLNEKEWEELEYLAQVYENIGYTVICTSANTGDGIEDLKEYIQNKTVLFFGNSGAGKSTLVNALQPGLRLKTGNISDSHRQGKHTTTFAEMHEWEFGGQVIDSPGVREFGLTEFDAYNLSHYFPEIFEIGKNCGFHNCTHLHEPRCAVQKAIEEGVIYFRRYENYLQMLESIS